MWHIHPSLLRHPLVFYILGKYFHKIRKERGNISKGEGWGKNNNTVLSRVLTYVLRCLSRNNMTILEVLRMSGRGASAQFRFGNRKPGSTTPLLFELVDKHFKDCERMYVSSSLPYDLKKDLYNIYVSVYKNRRELFAYFSAVLI